MHEPTNSSLKVIKKQTFKQAINKKIINKQINKHSEKHKILHPISPCRDPPQTKISCSPLGFSPENLWKLSVNRNPPPTSKLRGKAFIPRSAITIKIVDKNSK